MLCSGRWGLYKWSKCPWCLLYEYNTCILEYKIDDLYSSSYAEDFNKNTTTWCLWFFTNSLIIIIFIIIIIIISKPLYLL